MKVIDPRTGKLEQVIDSLLKIINNGQFIQGVEVFEFEKQLAAYLKVKEVVSCANGTDALQLVYMATLRKGDEVIIPAFNYVSSTEAAKLLGLNVRFCDVNYDTFNIDPSIIKLTRKTKAIVATHLFGQQANMTALREIADKYNILLIEDNAQSLGSTHYDKHLTGDVGITSFFPTKNLACMGDGGAVYTNDTKLAKKIRILARHGQPAGKKYHYDYVGINSRLDTIQAAILIDRLKQLDDKIHHQITRAVSLSSKYGWPVIEKGSTHTFNNFTIKSPHRDTLNGRIYYPLPLHKTKAYKTNISLPISEKLCKEVISLL